MLKRLNPIYCVQQGPHSKPQAEPAQAQEQDLKRPCPGSKVLVRVGDLSKRCITHTPPPSIPEHPTASLPARIGEAERGRAGGRSGVTPFTRDGVRQSRRRLGQPVQRGGPAGLLPGTGLRGRALTLRIWRDRRPAGALKARALGKRGTREPGKRGCEITHLGPQLRACRVDPRAPKNPGLFKAWTGCGPG